MTGQQGEGLKKTTQLQEDVERERPAQMDRYPTCTIFFAHSAVFRLSGPDWLVGSYSLRAWSFILYPLGVTPTGGRRNTGLHSEQVFQGDKKCLVHH